MFNWRETRTFFLLLWLMLAVVTVLLVDRFWNTQSNEELAHTIQRDDTHSPRVAEVTLGGGLRVNPVIVIEEPKRSIFAPSVHSAEDSHILQVSSKSKNPYFTGVCGIDIVCVPR